MGLPEDLARLNSQQRDVIDRFKGPGLVVAGPGTGKTRTIAVLIGRLLERGARMKEILALSFSEKAARELRDRIFGYFPRSFDECWISTFHSFCARILREQFHLVGVHPEFKLLTGFKEALLMTGICRRQNPESFPAFGKVLAKRGFQLEVLTFIALMKSNLVTVDQLERICSGDNELGERPVARLRELTNLFSRYEAERQRLGYLDFRDLIGLTIEVLRIPEAAEHYRKKFSAVLVDEFQDTDPAQFLLLTLLKGGEKRPKLAVIGDPRQSIYRFRGASPEIMGRTGSFQKVFKPRIFPLQENYRSASIILEAAGRLAWQEKMISSVSRGSEGTPAEDRDENRLIPRSGLQGFVEAFSTRDDLDEASLIARRIASLLIHGSEAGRRFNPREVAVLVRNNYQIDLIAEALRARGIPFEIAGDMKFFQSEEVTVLSSLLKLSASEERIRDECLRRVFVSPIFGLDPVWAQGVLAKNREPGRLKRFLETFETLASEDPGDPGDPGVSGDGPRGAVKRAQAFAQTALLLENSGKQPLMGILARLMLILRDSVADPASPPARNIFHFRNMVADFADVFERQSGRPPEVDDLLSDFDGLLNYFASTIEEEEPRTRTGVTLMTVHQAKGLEFPVTVVCGLCEGQFPVRLRENLLLGTAGIEGLKAILDAGDRPIPFFNPYPADFESHLEEERRLFFVAMTRAREGLILTSPRKLGSDPVLPSPFLAEIGVRLEHDWHESRSLGLREIRVKIARLSASERKEVRPALEELEKDLTPEERIRPPDPETILPRQSSKVTVPASFRFSSEALKDYLDCPRRFFFLRILGIRDPRESEDPALLFGNAVHGALQALHDPSSSPWERGKHPSDEDLDRLWEVQEDSLLSTLGFLARAERTHKAREGLKRYRDAVFGLNQIPPRGTISTENRLEFAFCGFPCVARFDRLVRTPDGLMIIDYKTTTSSTKSSAALAEEAFPEEGPIRSVQLPFYYLAARERHPGEPVCTLLLFVMSEAYKKAGRGFQPGFIRGAALNFGIGPEWGKDISPGSIRVFENRVEEIMRKITNDPVFDCFPSPDPQSNSCRNPQRPCRFRPFCQERLEELRIGEEVPGEVAADG